MSQGTKVILTPEQLQWLRDHFRDTKNRDIAEHLGCGETTIHRLARKMGLTKDPEFRAECQQGAADAAQKWWRTTGQYLPRKGLPEHLRQYQFQAGEKPWMRCGDEKWKEAVRTGSEKRAKTFREEKARRYFGLPQRTRLRVAKQPREKICARWYLKKHGYIIDDTNCVAYWTEDTKRCPRLEAAPRRYYYFKPIK